MQVVSPAKNPEVVILKESDLVTKTLHHTITEIDNIPDHLWHVVCLTECSMGNVFFNPPNDFMR